MTIDKNSGMPFWLAGFGIVAAGYFLLTQPGRDRKAFHRECSSNDSREQVWEKALRYARRHDRKSLEKLRELGRILPRAGDVIEVLKALPSVEGMLRDPKERPSAKRMVFRYWAKRWQEAMGLPTWSKKTRIRVLLTGTIDDKGEHGIFSTAFEEGAVSTIGEDS